MPLTLRSLRSLRSLTATAATALAFAAAPIHAQPNDNPLENVPFQLHLNLAKAHASPIGKLIMERVRDAKPNADELLDGLTDTLGLDLRNDIGSVVLSGQGINETDLQLLVDLGENTGKLEGWMLGLPGYESEELDDNTLLHSFALDGEGATVVGLEENLEEKRFMLDEMIELRMENRATLEEGIEDDIFRERIENSLAGAEREIEKLRENIDWLEEQIEQLEESSDENITRAFIALPQANGRFTLVATLEDDATRELTAQIREGDAPLDNDDPLQGDQILRLVLEDLAKVQVPRNAPGSAIFSYVQALDLTLGSGEQLTLDARMLTSSPARARQVTQLVQGLIAFSQLAALEAPEQAQQIADLLSQLNIQTLDDPDNPGVAATFAGSHQILENLIELLTGQ